MGIITRMRKQTAVYWARTSDTPDRYGKYPLAEPVEVACRWDDETVKFMDAKGTERISRSVVYPDRAVYPGDVLAEGTLAAYTGAGKDIANPLASGVAWQVQAAKKTPNLRNTETLYTAYL